MLHFRAVAQQFRDLARRARLRLGWSYRRAAEEVGLALERDFAESSYRYIEYSPRVPRDADVLNAVCEAYGWDVAETLRRIGVIRDKESA